MSVKITPAVPTAVRKATVPKASALGSSPSTLVAQAPTPAVSVTLSAAAQSLVKKAPAADHDGQ